MRLRKRPVLGSAGAPAQGVRIDITIVVGALTRLRPMLLIVVAASFGFLPMVLNTVRGGAEVQRPLTTRHLGQAYANSLTKPRLGLPGIHIAQGTRTLCILCFQSREIKARSADELIHFSVQVASSGQLAP